jgi:hypothetical protein
LGLFARLLALADALLRLATACVTNRDPETKYRRFP